MEGNSPSDIFKFVNVRPPQEITSERLEIDFIRHPFERIADANFWKDEYHTSLKKQNGPSLYGELQSLTNQKNYGRELVEEKVSKWVSPSRFDSVESIYLKFQGLQSIVDRIISSKNEDSHRELFIDLSTPFLKSLRIANTQKATGSLKKAREPGGASYVDRNVLYDLVDLQLRFWDILIREVVNGKNCNNQLKEEATLLIKVSYLLELAWSTEDIYVRLIPANILNRILVLPSLFPLPPTTGEAISDVAAARNIPSVAGANIASKKPAGKQVFIGGNLVSVDEICAEPAIRVTPAASPPVPLPQGYGQVKMLGFGDLLVVKKQLIKYEAGEIAHIENVMAGETRERKLRQLEREEIKAEQETESTTETEKELTTSDKFDLEKESNEIVKSDSSLEAGLTVSAKFGPVNVSASLNYATNKSKEESNKIASKMSQEITSRAVSKITEKVKELRSKLTIKETEETNTHSFVNTSEEDRIGIYQFIDKIYRAQVYNYGKRLFCELIVPRPAAQYIYFEANNNSEGKQLVKPIDPRDFTDSSGSDLATPLTDYNSIRVDNYIKWASLYNAEVQAPPAEKIIESAVVCSNEVKSLSVKTLTIDIPEGYVGMDVSTTINCIDAVRVGITVNGWWHKKKIHVRHDAYLTGSVPISIGANALDFWDSVNEKNIAGSVVYGVNFSIHCVATEMVEKQWKIGVFNAIIQAYQKQIDEYNEKLYQMEFGERDFGNNPNINRMIEAEELKKGCIQLITDQHFDSFSALQYNISPHHYPEFDNTEARKEGEYIQFFEQAFEWTQMTYCFYPYFWGNKPYWTVIKQYEDTDPLFTKFLQAGAARVMLPVRPGYESAVQYYLSTGSIWNGGETPVIGDSLFLSIVDEIKEADSQTEAEPLDTLPWEVKVPTNFVILSAEGELPKYPVKKPFIIGKNNGTIDDNYTKLKVSELNPDIFVWTL